MPAVTLHRPGSFCWIELATTDTAAAGAFYAELFGWETHSTPMGENELYTIFRKDGRDAAAMHGHTDGAPPNWLSYVAVDQVDHAVVKAKELGASILAGPMDVFDAGRMAVLADNQGAAFALWQANRQAGVGVRDESNALCWNELQAHDVDAAKHFYPPLFGWRMKESDEYTEWHLGENAVGGLMLSNAPADVPPHWLPYFAVDDCDAATRKAVSLGGSAIVSCMDIEHVGRFSVLADPQGAVFAMITLTL
ncbi:MAG TPA: VOC family protein [Thermoanaerobaculia bacterium]|jgi:predicted enzyme related to lactoylglutathione lyase|nr:VOC family protein [Thermoanaerobaculia bacterium]